MAEDQCNQDDEKFDFTAAGETLAYIGLDQAGVLCIRTAFLILNCENLPTWVSEVRND